MKNKLRLGENIERRCMWCKFSAPADEDTCFCKKKGVVEASGSCRKYEYDIFKRAPMPRMTLREHSKDEFSL